jgi:hypothetical protein
MRCIVSVDDSFKQFIINVEGSEDFNVNRMIVSHLLSMPKSPTN